MRKKLGPPFSEKVPPFEKQRGGLGPPFPKKPCSSMFDRTVEDLGRHKINPEFEMELRWNYDGIPTLLALLTINKEIRCCCPGNRNSAERRFITGL